MCMCVVEATSQLLGEKCDGIKFTDVTCELRVCSTAEIMLSRLWWCYNGIQSDYCDYTCSCNTGRLCG